MSTERSNSNTPLGNNSYSNYSQRSAMLNRSGSSIQPNSKIPRILPHERVFPIQIGTELFKLSGASISSDAPSYFSQYFLCQIRRAEETGQDINAAIKTLYIDRDPTTFKDICLHLQGYHVRPRDGTHFVRLFADAQFYSLPRFISQLNEESIFASIGHREFQIPRDVFSEPGNSPNFFTLGFTVFFSNQTDEVFPGLDREELIRPPSILPPSVPNRSAETFAEILHLLKGYPVDVRSEAHRKALLQDCRYFHLKGLEQRLIPHSITFNQIRGKDEIVLRLEDVLKSGVSVLPERVDIAAREGDNHAAWVNYARPLVDTHPAELVLEIGGECMRLHFNKEGGGGNGLTRLEFLKEGRTRVTKLFEVIASKLNIPPTTQPLGLLMASGGASSQPATPGNTPLSDDLVKCVLEAETAITLDGRRYTGHIPLDPWNEDPETNGDVSAPSSVGPSGIGSPTSLTAGLSLNPSRKRRRVADGSVAGCMDGDAAGGGGLPNGGYWLIRTGQWRLRIQGAKNGRGGVECVLIAVKLDALSGEHARNEARSFLRD
ncbi:hypothetical protein VP1G_08173 [Cytospora mali]|uniref:Potassium channel tetramerisation-type BTB domain-containing protein n=1 Tax=Cytospora mali TaxID=578113 RepID=A0A194VB10_CYTMA|nr:hypothetical protein VP1G_08173 [Valsa mali var. pyri (nom. inval.)]